MKIGIDELLLKQNKSRYWLSQQTGITYPNIKKLCDNNTTSIKFAMVETICKTLNCTPNDIFIINP